MLGGGPIFMGLLLARSVSSNDKVLGNHNGYSGQ
jgi:hypothetical protein